MADAISFRSSPSGAEVVLTRPDGSSRVVSWTWEQWHAFVEKHGTQPVTTALATTTTRWSGAGMFLEHAFSTSSQSLVGVLSLCGHAIHPRSGGVGTPKGRCASCNAVVQNGAAGMPRAIGA